MPLEAWDVAFWSERYRQAELHLSDEELKPYFPLDYMLDALRHLSSCLFGVHLVADDSIATWHPDVRFFWLEDADGSRFAGIFMDLFSRKGKRAGAWMDVCLSRRKRNGDVQRPVAYLTCNFAPPVGEAAEPADAPRRANPVPRVRALPASPAHRDRLAPGQRHQQRRVGCGGTAEPTAGKLVLGRPGPVRPMHVITRRANRCRTI